MYAECPWSWDKVVSGGEAINAHERRQLEQYYWNAISVDNTVQASYAVMYMYCESV